MTARSDLPILSSRSRKEIAGSAMSAGLCLIMCISLAGCFASAGKDGKRAGAVAAETVSSDAAYFSSRSIDFCELKDGEECYVLSVTPCGDKLAVLVQVSYDPNAESNNSDGSYSYSLANGQDKVVVFRVPPERGEAQSEDMSDGYSKTYVLLYSSAGILESTTDISISAGDDSSFMSAVPDRDGNLAMLVNTFDESTGVSIYKLVTLDISGKPVGEPRVLAFDKYFRPDVMILGNDGNMYFSGYKDMKSIVVMNKDGKLLFEISEASLDGYLYKDGDKIYCDAWEEKDGFFKQKFFEILVPEKKLGEAIDMSAYKGGKISSGIDGLYMSDAYGIYKVDLKAGQKTVVFEYGQADVLYAGNHSGSDCYVLTKDSILMINTEYTNTFHATKVTALLLSRETVNPNAGKEIIVLGGINLAGNSDVLEAVYDFNRESTEYYIEIRDYGKDEDYGSASTDKDYLKIQSNINSTMNLDILNGTGPDIVYGIYENTACGYRRHDAVQSSHVGSVRQHDFPDQLRDRRGRFRF